MLYGFGDVENPRQDTVELVEEMVVEYISDVVGKRRPFGGLTFGAWRR